MERNKHTWAVCVTLFLTGVVICVDITLENPKDGYFLKSPYSKYKAYDPNLVKETFFLTNTDKSQLIKAEFGPFEVYQSVPSIYLSTNQEGDNVTRVRHHTLKEDQDVSVHIVTLPSGADSPNLRVLLHISENADAKATQAVFDFSLPKDPNQRWCGRIYARYLSREISGACVLSQEKEACVADILIPADWWEGSLTYIEVFYSLASLQYSQRCTGSANSILPDRMFSDYGRGEKIYFTRISTLVPVDNYQEKKDQFVLLYVPTKTFHPGSKFEVPVKLEAESSLKVFTIRAKARNGLRIIRAEINAKSKWTISVDINSEQRSAVVKAYIRDDTVYSKTPWVQDIFRWWFEVDSTLDFPLEDGRIIWNIEYETTETGFMPMSRIVSHIQLDNEEEPLSIIPVLKVAEIVNMAVLTGKHQVYPLSVYTVSQGRSVVEITDAANCYSSQEQVIKVSEDCRNIYVDGTETAGSGNVSIIIKYGRETSYSYLKVWVPETRLDIQLSDSKLSQVKGWRSPKIITNRPMTVDSEAGMSPSPDPNRCYLRFQQAALEVFTRFHHPGKTPGASPVFYGNSKAYFRVTQLVKGRVRVSDPRIAELKHDKVINGKQPGRTEIQVLSPGGRVMAAKEIRVSKDKVVLEQVLVSMVTGISLEIKASKHVSGAFTGTAHLHHQLQGKYQEGVLDVMLKYSDGTVFPLQYVQPEQYHLDVISLNNHLIGIAPYASPYQPRVKALSQGKGNLLKVLLRLDNSCYRKKSHPLAATFVYVDVDITVEKSYLEDFQNDGGFLNRASDRKKDQKAKHANGRNKMNNRGHMFGVEYPDDKVVQSMPESGTKKVQVYSINGNSDNEDSEESVDPEHKPQLQYEPVDKGMTPLEIGMYVLLSIFCLAIVVFLVNLVIFFVFRFRRKKTPKVNRELVTNANDWVWIGRATLERTEVTRRSPQELMPASDFNGNHESSLPRKDHVSYSEPSSASNSNRNSTVSEYKGSEVSIRITNNPFEDEAVENESGLESMAGLSQSIRSGLAHKDPQWDYEAMGLTYDQLLDYFDNLKESSA